MSDILLGLVNTAAWVAWACLYYREKQLSRLYLRQRDECMAIIDALVSGDIEEARRIASCVSIDAANNKQSTNKGIANDKQRNN